jgi:hypothetical protein
VNSEPRHLRLADGTSKPLSGFTIEEIQALASGVTARREQDPSDTGTFRQLRDEMQQSSAEKVGDLNETMVFGYELMLGLRDPIVPLDDF